ncbi:hypothetical protein Tco_1237447 [Tanacetum coccineum]
MLTLKFAKTYNLVAFLEKPKESNGFKGIIDFLNASSIRYALTVNPIIYTSCIKQFWATAKVQTVNKEVQIQALVDGKKVIVTETSVRQALHLKDAKGTNCLPTATIFAELERMGQLPGMNFVALWPLLSSVLPQTKYLTFPSTFFVQVFLDKQVEGMPKHKDIYVIPSHTKKVFANMKREGKGFSGRVTPLFQTMMVEAPEEVGEGLTVPTDSHHTTTQPSTSRPHKKQSRRKQRKDNGPTDPIPDEDTNEEPISTPSYDSPQSDKDRLQLTELMSLCTKLQKQVLDLEEAKTAQAKEIASLKKRVKQLEKRRKSRTLGLKRLRKVGSASKVESSNDRNDEEMLFDVNNDLKGEEVVLEKEVGEKEVSAADPVTTVGEVVTTASATTTIDELTLAQNLIEIKAAKPKAVTTAATTITTAVASTRPKAKGIIFHDQEE